MVGLGDLPGGSYFSDGHGINDFDQVVGFSRSGSGGGNAQEAFLWDPEKGMIGLGFLPGGGVSIAYDINNACQVTGWGSSAERPGGEAFVWDPLNGMRGLGTMPGGAYGEMAYAINELGQVVGTASNGEAFLWDPVEGFTRLGVLPGPFPLSSGWGINDLEQVVGSALRDIAPLVQDAFIWDREHGIRDLEELLAAGTAPDYTSLQWASGINNAGQIVAHTYETGQGALLTPFVLGDMDCNELVDQADIPALLLLLVDPDEYGESYPDCPGQWAGDINQDGVLDLHDLHALRQFLGCAPSAAPGHYVPAERVSPVP